MRPNGFIKTGLAISVAGLLTSAAVWLEHVSKDGDEVSSTAASKDQPGQSRELIHPIQVKTLTGSILTGSDFFVTDDFESTTEDYKTDALRKDADKTPIAKTLPLSSLKIPPYVMSTILREQAELESGAAAVDPAVYGGGGGLMKPSPPAPSTSGTKAVTSNSRAAGPGPWSYQVLRFVPGLMNNGEPIMTNPDLKAIAPIIMGPPDYSLDTKNVATGKVLSLGNNGVITLEVVGGYVTDGDGPDFAVFENPFVYKDADGNLAVYAETGIVSVAEVDDPAQYRAFPCQSRTLPYTGCAGVTPVRYSPDQPLDQVGGDLFDLADVGLQRIKYIQIQDTGENQSFSQGTEGFDLDAIGLINTSY